MGVREQLLKKVDAELTSLERELRVELPRELAEAAAHGDLSENAEYEAAKSRKELVENLLSRLHQKRAGLSTMNTQMVPKDTVGFWSTVVVLDVDTGEEITYKLVTPDEADPKVGRVSVTSPIGRALAGQTAGDEVVAVTPRGTRTYEVVSFRTIHEES